jgi:uncharacterized linocin/CFP29 family protein
MNHLLRELAPIPEDGWSAIETEAKQRLTTYLAARKLVDFEGPHGWTHSSRNVGRVGDIVGPADEVSAKRRRVLPLVEIRTEFTVSRSEIDDAERGASDLELDDLDAAAKRIALSENAAVFHGYAEAGIQGITECTSHEPITLGSDYEHYPTTVARAVDVLRQSGIGGPYGLAIGPRIYTGIIESTEHGGFPVVEHLRQILGGPVVWAPGCDGGVVLSLRGGDFVFDAGQDIAIGYSDHDAEAVRLYLEESFTFRVIEPDAGVALKLQGETR